MFCSTTIIVGLGDRGTGGSDRLSKSVLILQLVRLPGGKISEKFSSPPSSLPLSPPSFPPSPLLKKPTFPLPVEIEKASSGLFHVKYKCANFCRVLCMLSTYYESAATMHPGENASTTHPHEFLGVGEIDGLDNESEGDGVRESCYVRKKRALFSLIWTQGGECVLWVLLFESCI